MINFRSITGNGRVRVRDFGTSLKFGNAETDRISLLQNSGLPITTSGDFTIACWIYTPKLASGKYFFSEGNSGSTNQVFGLHNTVTDKLSVWSRNNAAGQANQDGTVSIFKEGKWQHLVLTCISDYIRVYLDGIETSQTFTRTSGATTFNLSTWGCLGRTTFAGSWPGFLDECLLFNRPLTSEEIYALYAIGDIPSDGLIASHLLDEGSGTSATDSSGNGNTGTITGATYSTRVFMKNRSAASGRLTVRNFSKSLKFAYNTTDRIAVAQISGLPVTSTSAFTLAFWIKSPSDGGAYIFSEGNSGAAVPHFGLHYGSARKLNLFTKNNAGTGSDLAGTVDIFKPGEWQHIVVTGTNGAIKVFSNGVDTTQTFTRQSGATTFNLTTWGALGRNTYAGSVGALMDEMMIFNRVLSDAEILKLYLTGLYDSSGLVSYHKVDEGSGTSATDSSGNGNTGTITGATYSSDVPMVSRSHI